MLFITSGNNYDMIRIILERMTAVDIYFIY